MKNKLTALSKDKNRMWAVPGLIEFEQIESAKAALNVQPYLDYFERQVYAALNVPPVLMGKPEGSNRTTAKVMMDSFERYVNSLQAILADSVKVLLRRFGFGEVPELVFDEIAPEDEASRVLRLQRMLGSDRSTGWITVDEARELTPEVHGNWAEVSNKQSISKKEKEAEEEAKQDRVAARSAVKRQQPPGMAPGESPAQKRKKPPPSERGEKSGTRSAGERGSQTTGPGT
jgi:hypothetical protein